MLRMCTNLSMQSRASVFLTVVLRHPPTLLLIWLHLCPEFQEFLIPYKQSCAVEKIDSTVHCLPYRKKSTTAATILHIQTLWHAFLDWGLCLFITFHNTSGSSKSIINPWRIPLCSVECWAVNYVPGLCFAKNHLEAARWPPECRVPNII